MLRRLSAPAPARAGLELVAADALQPPFADGAFDTVVTPWFIDIIGEPFARVAARVNLRSGPVVAGSISGRWRFRAPRMRNAWAWKKCRNSCREAGFADLVVREASIPYMRSPASRHARVESTVTWVANRSARPRKRRARACLPEWLLQPDKPVPRTPAFEMQAISSRVHAFLLALINGERSMRDMARVLVEQRLMPPQEAEAQVRCSSRACTKSRSEMGTVPIC